ncbi:MAG TPA: hypothetical protein VFA49_05690 [Chloroflexota bacterium]|jgi:hypothetical protein|nr:hypothetical protein [Chloroflexota bacterium]
MPSSPPPDKFQREIDDIIRLAERRLDHQSFGYRMRRSTRRLGGVLGGFNLRLPPVETMGGWGLALLLASWLLSLLRFIPFGGLLSFWALVFGIALLTAALVLSLLRGRGVMGGREKVWRGERVYYGSPYSDGFLSRLRRILRGRR